MMPDLPFSTQPFDDLETKGYAVVEDFLDAAATDALAGECRALNAQGTLRSAGVGHGVRRALRTDIRGDRMLWFDQSALAPAQSVYWARVDALRLALNRRLMLGLAELQAHYALYPPGTRYARHRDRFRDDDTRVLSSVLYLNRDWQDEDGGALRLYLSGDAKVPHVDIAPAAGRLVLFLSADFEHEVLPAKRERLSVAGWFSRRKI